MGKDANNERVHTVIIVPEIAYPQARSGSFYLLCSTKKRKDGSLKTFPRTFLEASQDLWGDSHNVLNINILMGLLVPYIFGVLAF